MNKQTQTNGEAPRPARWRRALRSAYLWVPLLAVLDTLVVEAFNHKVFTAGFASFGAFLRGHPLAFAVDALLVALTLAPALFLRRRVFWCTLLSAFWLILGGVNGFILMSRMTPFTTADLTVLNTGLDTLPNYMSTGYIALLAVLLLGLAALLVFLFWKGPKSGEPLRRRLLGGAAALAVSGGLLTGVWALAFRTEQLSTVFSNLAFAYEDYGFSYCFLQTWLNKGIRLPAGYGSADMGRINAEISADLSALNEGSPLTPREDVNVVFVQLESFMDPAEILGLELSEDAVPAWHALEEGYTSGYLRVPVVGAGTANTEFEVLTGMSSRLFGPGEYPYKTCLQTGTAESVAYDLKALGYGAHAIHNHRATFYTRNTVYANLGFDDFTSLEYMPRVNKTPRGWSKDYILTGQICDALDATEGSPDLVFTVSVQGHGSYPTEEALADPAVTVTACPEGVNAYAVEYYVNQMREMDDFIRELVNQLALRREKTVLVLYGDHLPSLNLTARDMAGESLYKTKYVIWDNFGLEENDRNLYAYQLSAETLRAVGITGGKLAQFHQACQNEPTYRSDLRAIQYDLIYGRKYLYGGTMPYNPTELQMGVNKISITALYPRSGFWYVRGDHFTPYCKITVGDKILDTTYVSDTLLRINEEPGTQDVRELFISVVDLHREVLSDTE